MIISPLAPGTPETIRGDGAGLCVTLLHIVTRGLWIVTRCVRDVLVLAWDV